MHLEVKVKATDDQGHRFRTDEHILIFCLSHLSVITADSYSLSPLCALQWAGVLVLCESRHRKHMATRTDQRMWVYMCVAIHVAVNISTD